LHDGFVWQKQTKRLQPFVVGIAAQDGAKHAEEDEGLGFAALRDKQVALLV
jgi:hypothetical protein